MSTEAGGEVTPFQPRDHSPLLAELGSLDAAALMERLGSGSMVRADEDEYKTQSKPVRSPNVYWQAPTDCWIFLSGKAADQFDVTGQRVWKTEEERQQALMRELVIDELDVSDEDKESFTKTLEQSSNAFYRELLRLCAVQLGYNSATDKIMQTMQLLLDDPHFTLKDVQIKSTLRDLVDLKFTEAIAKQLRLGDVNGVLNARMAALAQFIPRNPDDSKLSELRALLQMRGPE